MAIDFHKLSHYERPTVIAQTADRLVDALKPNPLLEGIADAFGNMHLPPEVDAQLRIARLKEADVIDPEELERLRAARA